MNTGRREKNEEGEGMMEGKKRERGRRTSYIPTGSSADKRLQLAILTYRVWLVGKGATLSIFLSWQVGAPFSYHVIETRPVYPNRFFSRKLSYVHWSLSYTKSKIIPKLLKCCVGNYCTCDRQKYQQYQCNSTNHLLINFRIHSKSKDT